MNTKKLKKTLKHNDKEILLNSLWLLESKKLVDGKWYIPLSQVIKLLGDK